MDGTLEGRRDAFTFKLLSENFSGNYDKINILIAALKTRIL